MKISEATLTFRCAHPDCEEELIIDIGDTYDFDLLKMRAKNEFIRSGWKLFSREEITFCSNQHMLSAREGL